MKVLVLEYITAGGLAGQALPTSLLREGELMRDALLADFSMLATARPDALEIYTTYDVRLAPPQTHVVHSRPVQHEADAKPIWQAMLKECDAALIVAPETGGILAELTQMIEQAGVKNLGCQSQAVIVASDKYQTYQQLKQAHILTIATYKTDEFVALAPLADGYIAKPVDGAGCEDTLYFEKQSDVLAWAKTAPPQCIIQPYQTGIAASISMLCHSGKAWLLACNQQRIAIEAQALKYRGSVVNGLCEYQTMFTEVANKIAAALPALNGYVGVDVIVDGDKVYVVEINPRITTSYIALHQSISINPAQLLLDLAGYTSHAFALPPQIAQHPVEVSLHA